jgi:hypothetical protein
MPPQERKNESAIPSAASDWRKETLDLLNAKYDPCSITDFTFNGVTVPTELQMGMADYFPGVLSLVVDQVTGELSEVNNSKSITPEFNFKVSDRPFVFAKFYDDFTQIVRKNMASTVTSQTATPILQTTIPQPYSSPSTASTSSRESKAEPHTQITANDFMWATLKAIENHLEEFAWYSNAGYRLKTTYISAICTNVERNKK